MAKKTRKRFDTGVYMAHGGKVELIFHGSSKEIPMGEFDSAADAKRYVESSDWQRPYSIRKINKTPKVVRTQFEEEVFEYAKGGEPKPSLIPDYKKISNVEVEDIDRNDYPDFSDAYISYAEYDGEPMTDEQLEELNQDGLFVYDAIHRRLFAKGGKVKVSKSSVISELEKLGFGNDKAKNLLEKHIDIYEINEDDEDAKTIAMSIEEAYNQEYARGGKVKSRWIQDALSGDKGALRKTAKRKGLIKGEEKLSKSDLRKLEKMGGKTAKRARLAETLIDFKK